MLDFCERNHFTKHQPAFFIIIIVRVLATWKRFSLNESAPSAGRGKGDRRLLKTSLPNLSLSDLDLQQQAENE